MIQVFDSKEAERFGMAAAVILNNIRNAIILRDDMKYPSWDTSEEYFYYIHRYMGKKAFNDAITKLKKLGIIEIYYPEDGKITISTTRLLDY